MQLSRKPLGMKSVKKLQHQRDARQGAAAPYAYAPLYSIPHFNLTITGFPVKSFRNGFGLTGTVCAEAGRLVDCLKTLRRGRCLNTSRTAAMAAHRPAARSSLV